MKTPVAPLPSATSRTLFFLPGLATALLLTSALATWADQIEMQNGDRYIGTVVSLDADTLLMRNDVLGSVRLPRNKVLSIAFGQSATKDSPVQSKTNASLAKPVLSATNLNREFTAAIQQLNGQTNLIQQVQGQFLADAGPEANNRFNDLLSGLMTGKLTLGDLRKEAKSAADQLRALKKDLGDDSGFAVDGYLSILEGFLEETSPAEDRSTVSTNRTRLVSPVPAR